jgi:hypothetical protein
MDLCGGTSRSAVFLLPSIVELTEIEKDSSGQFQGMSGRRVVTMTRQIKLLMSGLVALLSLTFIQHASAKDGASTTYRCHAKDAVSVLQDGTLNKLIGHAAMNEYDKIVIDVADGQITLPFRGHRQKWVVQKADVGDDEYVLYPESAQKRRHTIANVMTQYIRLRAAKSDPQPRYIVVTLSYIVTGTCELLK